MPSRFETRLREGPPIVADGGMGALISAAVPRLRCPEEANVRAPESVVSVHVGYIRAGAELIRSNSSSRKLDESFGLFAPNVFVSISSAPARM